MMRSMFAAVSSLRNHQTRMDVVANNIANVNTVAFKSSRATFQDVFYQTLSGGSAPDDNRGGINPRQVGVGMSLNSIDTMFVQGNVEPTDNITDLMIQGDGFFILTDSSGENEADGSKFYTRAGVFGFDAEGNLINKSDGKFVMGYTIGEDEYNDDLEPLTWDIMTGEGGLSISDLNTLTINSNGEIIADGDPIAVIALAKFPNNEGLDKMGENQFTWASAAGGEDENGGVDIGKFGTAGDGDKGFGNTVIVPGAIEMSNVELAKEFTDMIITQR
ncbi:MAG: flagellar hook-basal body complex protein, partial [Clostridia bacterium]|nr:flagellar hook-basal body complex protein [Clostridia bacterium]